MRHPAKIHLPGAPTFQQGSWVLVHLVQFQELANRQSVALVQRLTKTGLVE
jgi:hypothetical protein